MVAAWPSARWRLDHGHVVAREAQTIAILLPKHPFVLRAVRVVATACTGEFATRKRVNDALTHRVIPPGLSQIMAAQAERDSFAP